VRERTSHHVDKIFVRFIQKGRFGDPSTSVEGVVRGGGDIGTMGD